MALKSILWSIIKTPFTLIVYLIVKKRIMLTISLILFTLLIIHGTINLTKTGNPTDLIKSVAEPIINQDKVISNEIDYLKELKTPDTTDLLYSGFNILTALWFFYYIFYFGTKYIMKLFTNQSLPYLSYFLFIYLILIIMRILYALYLTSLGETPFNMWWLMIPLYSVFKLIINIELFIYPLSNWINRFRI